MVKLQKIYLKQFLELGLSYRGLELPSPVESNPGLSFQNPTYGGGM